MIDKLENKMCDLTTEHMIYIFLYKMENFMIHAVVLYYFTCFSIIFFIYIVYIYIGFYRGFKE